MHICLCMYIPVFVCVCVCVEAANERHMKMSVACVSYTRLAAPCAYTHTHHLFFTFLWHSSVYSNSLTYPSLSDMLLLQCPQWGHTPLDVAEKKSKEEAAEVLRRHGAKRGAEL